MVFRGLVCLALFCGIAFPIAAHAMTPEEAAARLFSAEQVERDWFAHQGLASAVPPLIAEMQESMGPFQRVTPCEETCLALYEGGEFNFNITIDRDARITGLLMDVPIVYASSMDDAISAFRELPGAVSVLVTHNGVPVASLNDDSQMAVGSAFKLAVLKALSNLVGAGKLEWDQVVAFDAAWRSLPSGQMQDWPDGAPVTLHTLASLMTSVSDNTATDALIDLVTRNSVESVSPGNRPFLTTREMFQLRHRDHGALQERFLAGDYDEKMRVLSELDAKPLPRVSELELDPSGKIEWFMSTRELCRLMDSLGPLDVLGINPGVARKADWKSISFKGGSNAGVLNLTTGLVRHDGQRYCVSATWNDDAALDEEGFTILYASLLHLLKEKAAP